MDEQQHSNVWERAEERYQAGQEVQGRVTRVAQFGVFLQVEPDLEGIVYTFELGNTPAALAGFTPGQELQCFVKSIDSSRKRLELGLIRDSMPLPLDERALPPETRPSAPVQEFSQFPRPDAGTLTPPACPTCQRQLQSSWKFCVYCGSSLRRQCPACGSIQPDLAGARFCFECGTPILASRVTTERPER